MAYTRCIAVKELAGENLLLEVRHCFRDQILNACPDYGQTPAADHPLQKSVEGTSLETGAPHGGLRHGHHGTALHRGGLRSHGRRLLAIKPFKPLVPQRRIALAGAAVFRARTPSSCWPTPFASVGWTASQCSIYLNY